MGEQMVFPETFDEFAEQYKLVDTKQVYTNGTELIPVFRVRQWLMRPDPLAHNIKTAKSEAYKEFAEKLENRILSMLTTATLEEKEIICACIGTNNNLLKELVGENDAR